MADTIGELQGIRRITPKRGKTTRNRKKPIREYARGRYSSITNLLARRKPHGEGRRSGGCMLIPCCECRQQISDQAETCPHCGVRIKGAATNSINHGMPIFLALAVIGFALSLFTPRFLLTFPLMATLGLSTVSFFRKEKWRGGAITVFVGGIALMFVSGISNSPSPSPSPSPSHSNTANMETAVIEDWNWHADPKFGTGGTIKWNVSVRNKSNRNMKDVKVEFTTYDGSGKLVATTFAYVKAIPAGDVRSESSFADYYRNEKSATARVSEVWFAD